MIKITDTEVSGWRGALRGMRNPKDSWHLSDTIYFNDLVPPDIGKNDLRLAQTLADAGNEHGKYLRMISVSCDIVAPVFWLAELDTYKVGTVRNSCSMMHKGMSRKYTPDMFTAESLCPNMIAALCDTLNEFVDRYKETKEEEYFRALRELMPMGYNYRVTWYANYAVLRTIYHQRKNHRLQEWKDFCKWIESLPYSCLIIGAENEKERVFQPLGNPD